MRWLVLFLTAIFLSSGVFAQSSSGYSSSELDTLVGPVALYPDPLLNSIIAGAAHPDQIKAAAQAGGKNPKSDWDTSVMALCDYPDVLTMMNKNAEWTQAIGWAGVNQGQDLMDAVQRFRYQAQSAGNLQTDDKMEVIDEGSTIRIEPANPQIVYVPSYQPQTVIVENNDDAVAAGVIGFGVGIATSALLYNNYWHGGAWYHPPYGWFPPAGWNRPYGWNSGGASWFGANNAYSPRTNINRPVNINNINTGNINIGNRTNIGNGNRNNIGNGNRNNGNRINNRPAVTPNPRPSVLPSQRPSFQSARPNFQAPNLGNFQRPDGGGLNGGGFQRPSGGDFQRPGGGGDRQWSRPQNTNFNRPAMSDYSRSGTSSRESFRGAQSRGTRSFSGGGGGRAGGRRR